MDFTPPPSSAEPSLREELGLPPFPPLSDDPSPIPVDRYQIRDLLEGQLSSDEFKRVYALIHTYRDWHNAQLDVILNQYETWRKLKESLGESTTD